MKSINYRFSAARRSVSGVKLKYGGMEAADIKRLKHLEQENRRLKQMFAELSLEHTILKDIEVDLSLPAKRVTRVLDRLIECHGTPNTIRMDNGLEFISLVLADWAETNQVELSFIQPGKPTQNAYIERFNKTYRHEVLNRYLFKNLHEVRQVTESWIHEYNTERPHESLNNLTPHEYLVFNNPQNSTLDL